MKSSIEAKYIAILGEREWTPTNTIARKAEVQMRAARQSLKKLEERGIVEKKGTPKMWQWRIKP